MKNLLKEYMTTSFNLLANTLTPTEANAQLAAGNYGVVLDQNDTPTALIITADLAQAIIQGAPALLSLLAGLPPTVIVGSEIPMAMLVESEALLLFELGGRGAIVLDDEQVVGVLPVELIDEYLGSGAYRSTPRTMGPSAKSVDAALGGKYQTPYGVVTCLAVVEGVGCHHPNKLTGTFDQGRTMCQNQNLSPHSLKIATK